MSRRSLVALIALLAAALLGFAWTWPPAPVAASAPAGVFSAMRAMAHVEEIARRPHRIGSAEHARVRRYLMDQLRTLDLAPEIQETVVRRDYERPRFATVRNVVARRAGTGGGMALLLMAHYDSRPTTPGASDDGYGVATLLETARALASGPPLASDVIFLFTDGEEDGLLGAHAFVSRHPWAARVGLVLNFEARGNAGPVLMFQTGDDNGALVRELARAAPHIAASSLSRDLYRRMPNSTDLQEWLPRTPSFDFANIDGFARYHAPTDTAEAASARTLQHHGSYALALARAFGDRTLPLPREPDAAYFDAGPFFVHYPGAWTRPLAAAACLALVIFLVIATRARQIRAEGVGLGLVSVIGVMFVAAAASAGLWVIAQTLHPAYADITSASAVMKSLYVGAFLALAIAVAVLAQARLARRLRAAEIFAGAALLCAALTVLLAAYLPGGAFLFTWPLLLASLAGIGLARFPLQIAAPIPAIVIIGPLLPQLAVAFGPSIAPAAAALAALITMLAAPAVQHLPRRATPRALLAIAALAYLAASLIPPFGRDAPKPDTLVFAVDRDAGRAYWVSADPPDAWTSPLLEGATREPAVPLPFPFLAGAGSFVKETTPAPEPGPEIVWISEDPRSMRVRIVPPPGAELVGVHVDGRLSSARVAGLPVQLAPDGLSFLFYAPPVAGIDIELHAAAAGPVTVRAVSQRNGFPVALPPRPPGLMAAPARPHRDDLLESDTTVVSRTSTRP